ncbi:MAG: DNA polymerase III subunit delta' [Acholeplasmataceae bacterium]|nr:DNA polymerase III subunit delta' [Acholeplasmataceae bacterium]
MWENIRGHEQNKHFLQQLLVSGKRTPSLLFLGPGGIGKKALATAFAKDFLCRSEKLPCSGCPSCQAFNANGHPDFLLVEQSAPGKEIVIDQIKEIARQAAFAPNLSAHKVCIIDAADYMNLTAANSLLKLLEEPPRFWLFILIANTAARLLPTIRSRVIQLRFDALPAETIEAVLAKEGARPEEAVALAHLADGSIGTALNMLKSNTVDCRNKALTIFEQLPTQRPLQLTTQYGWPEKTAGEDGMTLLEMMLFILRDALLCKEGMAGNAYNIDVLPHIEKCFADWHSAKIKNIIKIVQESYMAIAANASGKVVWEAMLVRMNMILKED